MCVLPHISTIYPFLCINNYCFTVNIIYSYYGILHTITCYYNWGYCQHHIYPYNSLIPYYVCYYYLP